MKKDRKITYYNDSYELCERDPTALEKEFLELKDRVHVMITEKVSAAAKLLEEAEQISEKHGMPFHSSVSFIRNTFTPTSFEKKFGKLANKNDEDFNFLHEVADMYIENGITGWEHSAIC